jgi:hypothetical protein
MDMLSISSHNHVDYLMGGYWWNCATFALPEKNDVHHILQ